jgi:hypothetical protein
MDFFGGGGGGHGEHEHKTPSSKMLLKVVFDKRAFVRLKISNNFCKQFS